MTEPVGPIFMLDGGDLAVIAEPGDAAREWEAFLADQPVEFFDALARPVQLVTARDRTIGVELASGNADEDHLRSAIGTYLRATGKVPPDEPSMERFSAAVLRLLRAQLPG